MYFFAVPFLIMLIFLSLGLYLLIPNLRHFLAIRKLKKWEIVAGVITEIDNDGKWISIQEKTSLPSKIQLKYHYLYKNKKYESSCLNLEGITYISKLLNQKGTVYLKDVYLIRNRISKSPYVSVWVNPNNASQSVLLTSSRQYLFKILTGMTLVIWALPFIWIIFLIGNLDISENIEVVQNKTPQEIDASENPIDSIR